MSRYDHPEPGIIIYTQHTVAFPTLHLDRELDDLNVSITGLNGSIEFSWVELGGGYSYGALKVHAFSDSFEILLDERIADLLKTLRDERPAVGEVVRLLEERGAHPSHYHVNGMLSRPTGVTLEEKARLQVKLTRAKELD